MLTPSDGGSGFRDPEAELGGADAVPDTPDVPAAGTEPEQDWAARARRGFRPWPATSTATWALVGVAIVVSLLAINGAWTCHA